MKDKNRLTTRANKKINRKMKYTKIIFFIILISLNSYSQKINTEAINKFWNIVDYIKKDKPLTDSVWNNYYDVVGNKKYMENNRSSENVLEHRRYLELVFRPSLSDSLIKVAGIKNKDQKENIFQNLYFIKKNEQKLRNYTEEIESPAYLIESIKLAKKYLPKNKYNEIPKDLTFYIMAMTYDAAVQDNNMYFGLACVYDLDRLQKGAVAAHEVHHVLRKTREFKNELSTADSTTVNIVSMINNEGSADLIDKPFFTNPQTVRGAIMKVKLLETAEAVVKKIDSCFILNSKKEKIFTTNSDFNKIISYSSGHIPGYYMVDIIKKNGYENELIKNNDNPFNFFFLYNKAAIKDKNKPVIFSENTIKYLKLLEKQLKSTK